jgi:hypothetical protein
VKILKRVDEMLIESRMMDVVKMWSLDGLRKDTGTIRKRFCKKILGLSRFSANSVAELKAGGGSKNGKGSEMIVKY